MLGLTLYCLRRRSFRGQAFLSAAFGYAFVRFLIELVRDDVDRGTWGPRIAAHVYVPLMLLVFAAAYNYGPARSVGSRAVKRFTQLASLAPALLAWLLLRPSAGARSEVVQLSTSQWIALGTAVAVAAVWSRLLSLGAPQGELKPQSST